MSLYDDLQDKLEDVHVYSNYFMCRCIFHDWTSHTASLMVHDDGEFHCLACPAHGNIEYLAKVVGYKNRQPSHLTRSQSHILPKWKNWERQFGDVQDIAKKAHKFLLDHPEFAGFFKKRGIYHFLEQGYFGYLDGWNLFPVFDDKHRVIDIVVRAWKGKGDIRYVLHPDQERQSPYVYVPDYDKIKSAQKVYITFGIIDAWSLYAIGLPSITGTSGKSLSASQVKKQIGDKYFVIIPDRYEEQDAYELAGELGWKASVKRLHWLDGTKDCDEVRMQYGEDCLRELIGE